MLGWNVIVNGRKERMAVSQRFDMAALKVSSYTNRYAAAAPTLTHPERDKNSDHGLLCPLFRLDRSDALVICKLKLHLPVSLL